ncbi:MAG: SDR family oxidoreductase [Solirubrobacterales bacterium]
MGTGKRIAVAGGTGRVGKHVVELLKAAGHEVVPMSRSSGVDVITGHRLAAALSGAKVIVDAATGPSPDEAAATEFFTTATRNLHEAGAQVGVERLVVVSIIGCDRFAAGYNAAKVAHEQAALAGPIPARILRAAQFHEFVEQILDWGTQGEVGYVPEMRTQLVAARAVAEALVELAVAPDSATSSADGQIPQIAGPRIERLVEMARLVAAKRGGPERVEEANDPYDPDRELFGTDGLLPGPHATLAGPTFEQWLAIEGDEFPRRRRSHFVTR